MIAHCELNSMPYALCPMLLSALCSPAAYAVHLAGSPLRFDMLYAFSVDLPPQRNTPQNKIDV